MKNRIISIAMLSVVVLIVACEPPVWHRMRSMIASYYEPWEFKAQVSTKNENSVSIHFTDGQIYNFRSKGSEKEVYDRLCEKHNDMSFNRKMIERYPGNVITHVDKDFSAIEIISDKDWNTEHPAGSSLGDITMFYSVSPIKYIQSGYKDEFDWDNIGDYPVMEKYFTDYYHLGIKRMRNSYHPVIKLVSELITEDLILLGGGSDDATMAILEFTTLPTSNKEHNITVTLTSDEGETFSASIKMVFE